MASLVDVAKLANVSITTASRVLSGSTYPVSDEKRERVLAAATELNYSPSALAKALVTGDTKIVGVIIGDSTDPYFATIVRGVDDAARLQGYLVIVCNSDRDPQVELSYLKTLNDYRVDGVIFAGGGLDDEAYVFQVSELLGSFRDRGAVCISLGKHLFPSFPILVDNQQIVQDAIEHLVSLGHKRIGYISGPELLTTTQARLAGYQAGVRKYGLDEEPELVLQGDYSYQSGLQAAEAFTVMKNKPTAILASNDLMGIGCLAGLRERGYHIPADISIIGIDDITFSRFVDPPLTTIIVPMYELGRVGMETLLALREGEDLPHKQILLPHKLVVRKSTGAPSAKKPELSSKTNLTHPTSKKGTT
jgi:LacI family transcriptional regulator